MSESTEDITSQKQKEQKEQKEQEEQEEQKNRIQEVVKKELAVEKFVELILRNGQLLKGSLTDGMVVNDSYSVREESFIKYPQGTYLFKGELYTVKFKAEKIEEYYSRSRNITTYRYKLTPVAIEKLEVPTK